MRRSYLTTATSAGLLRGDRTGRDGKMTANWVIKTETLRPPQGKDEESHHRQSPVSPAQLRRAISTLISRLMRMFRHKIAKELFEIVYTGQAA